MDIDSKKGVVIPPYWVDLVVGVICIVAVYWYCGVTTNVAHYMLKQINSLSFLGFLIIAKGLTHFSIHPNGIWMRFLWIPIRWIPWDKVFDAQFIQEWTTTGSAMTKTKGQGIVVTLVGCELFNPEVDGLNMFLLRHPIGSFFIRFAAKKKDLYVDIFRKYFPNLCFQFEGAEHE